MSNLDQPQLKTPQKKLTNVSPKKADTLSKMASHSPAPAATSSKPRSVSRSSRKDESFSQRVPMEEEPNPSSELRYQSFKAHEQEQEMEQEGSQNRGHTNVNLPIYMQIEKFKDLKNNENPDFTGEKGDAELDNNGEGLNNSLGAEQGCSGSTNPTRKADMLACLEKMTMADIKKKFFVLQQCLPCRINISKKYRDHIKNHIKGKKSIKCNYSFDLHADGQSLQIKCKKCQQTFTDLTAKKLEEHNQACNSRGINSNNASLPIGSMDYNALEKRLEKKFEGRFKALENKMTSFGTRVGKIEVKLAGVRRTQGTMKKKLDNTEKRVADGEEKLKVVEEKGDNHENVLMGLLHQAINQGIYEKPKEAITDTSVFSRLIPADKAKNQSKEVERERDRSRERARNGSPEKRTTRQRSRDQRDQGRERERYEDRRPRRRENSEERSRDKRQTRYDNNRQQSYRDKSSNRRY